MFHKSNNGIDNTDAALTQSIKKFLKFVAEGRQKQAENLLVNNPELMYIQSEVTDYSKRTFKKISPLQYAAWAYDIHMLRMMLKYVHPEDKIKAYQELQDLDENGTEHGSHFDFTRIIDSLEHYLRENSTFWKLITMRNICRQQCSYPAHVVNEFCHPTRSFQPTPKFHQEAKLIRSFMINTQSMHWFSKLCERSVIVRGRSNSGAIQSSIFPEKEIKIDLEALRALAATRSQELAGIKQWLVGAETDNLFLNLPTDIISYYIPAVADENNHYHAKDATLVMKSLSETCRTLNAFFKPELNKRKSQFLLRRVLHGELDLTLIRNAEHFPEVFFIRSTMHDFATDLDGNRRLIKNWSPYQAMFGTGDVDMLKEIKPYLDVYLDKIPNGHEMALGQEEEKFPDGLSYPESDYDFTPVVTAITKDVGNIDKHRKPCTTLLIEINKFRKYFTPGIVEKEQHFNFNHFIKALIIDHKHSKAWSLSQHVFYHTYVLGFLERLITAPYLQRACLGLSLAIRKAGVGAEFGMNKEKFNKLGQETFIDLYFGRYITNTGLLNFQHLQDFITSISFSENTISHLKCLVDQNTDELSKMMHPREKEMPACRIC